jgi:hypothetical protein
MIDTFDDPVLIHFVHVPISYVLCYLQIILLRNLYSNHLPHPVPYRTPQPRVPHKVMSTFKELGVYPERWTPVSDDLVTWVSAYLVLAVAAPIPT